MTTQTTENGREIGVGLIGLGVVGGGVARALIERREGTCRCVDVIGDFGGVSFEHGHAKGDVALRGTASDLLLWAWNRVPVDECFEVFGDRAPLEAWREAVRF